jgi:ribonuclease-3
MPPLEQLAAHLGVAFSQPALLQEALTHRSFLNERVNHRLHLTSNERLEFLGDSVVNYVAANLVYERYAAAGEGDLTSRRTALIRTETLATCARHYDLGRHIRIGRGEELAGARDRDAMLADTFEAVVAAIFLDGGLDAARAFLLPLFERELTTFDSFGLPTDDKSALQTTIQASRSITPRYQVITVSGPEHRREFTVEVLAADARLGTGTGASKQAAEQAAARDALARLRTAQE